MPESAKERNKRWMPSVIACAVLIGTATWVSTLLPQEHKPRSTGGETAATTVWVQVLGVSDGQLTRFAADGKTVLEVYEVAVVSLPDEVQARLAEGIRVTSERELATWLENYTS